MDLAVTILVTDKSAQIKSNLPVVLQPILGRPLLGHVLRAIKPLNPVQTVIAIESETDSVTAKIEHAISLSDDQPLSVIHLSPSNQDQNQHIHSLLKNKAASLLVVPGDLPLLTTQTLRQLIHIYQSTQAPLALLTVTADLSDSLDRIIRDEQGNVATITAKAPLAQKAVAEFSVGVYIVQANWLRENLATISLESPENYLTDLVNMAAKRGEPVQTGLLADPTEAIRVKNYVQLADVEAALRRQVNQRWLEAGIRIVDPATTYIDLEVTLGPDTIIYPNTYLLGKTVIGKNCVIGPNSLIENSTLGDDCLVRFSVVEQAVLENKVDIGPFAHLRKGAHLAEGVHMGNFGEVKNSYLGPGTKMGHFSYLGDARTGTNVNIGAGTITCNYDGVNKNLTNIGDNAFIGSDTMLIAPVNVGKNAKTGAGTVVTKDIPDNSLAYGVPARIKSSDTT